MARRKRFYYALFSTTDESERPHTWAYTLKISFYSDFIVVKVLGQ